MWMSLVMLSWCFYASGVFPPTMSTPYIPSTPGNYSVAQPITAVSSGPEVIFSGKHNGISIYFSRILGSVSVTVRSSCYDINRRVYIEWICYVIRFRNIWDGSLAMEKIINTGNQTVTIVSMETLFNSETHNFIWWMTNTDLWFHLPTEITL